MNGEEEKITKEKILELMDSADKNSADKNSADKNSAAYKQVMNALKRHDSAMSSINGMLQVKNEDYPEMYAQLIEKTLSMEEIVKTCLSFQQISNTPESGKMIFDFLMEPIIRRLSKLAELEKDGILSNYYQKVHSLIQYQKKNLEHEIKTGCIDLQYELDSFEVKNHALKKSIKILDSYKREIEKKWEIPNSVYESIEGRRYRGIIIDYYFKKMEQNPFYKKGSKEEFQMVFDYLKQEQYLPKLLQRADLSEIEKKTYIHAAVTQSNLPVDGDDITYFRNNVRRDLDSNEMKKQIAEKEIIYLIAKEVNTDTAITLDEMLRGNRKKTADIMAKLYAEVPLTIVKEHIRNQVEISFDPEEKLAFYKKSVLQSLTQKKFPGVGSELYATLDPNVPILTKLDQFEKIYTAFESPESKQQYDYPESKELLASLRKCLFGDSERKVETILLIKQEAPDEKMNMPELVEKNIEDLEDLRISNGLRAINAKTFVPDSFPEGADKKKLHIEGLADTMFKLKAHLSNWDDKIQEQVKKQLTTRLKEEEKNQVVEIFNEKEAVHQIFAVSPELEKEWEKILVTPDTTNMKSMVDELKSRLGKDFLLLLKDNTRPVTKNPKAYDKGEEKPEDMVTDLIKMKIGENIYRITKELECFRHKAKDVRDLRTELINRKHNVQNTLKDALIFVRKNRDSKISIEKQFFDELCRSEVIQDFIKQDPKLKNVLYECQKLAPLNEYIGSEDDYDLKYSKRMNQAFYHTWWRKYWHTFDNLLNGSVSEKQSLIFDLNHAILTLWKRDVKLCTNVVHALLRDSAGGDVRLNTSFVGDFRFKKAKEQQNRAKAKKLMNSYIYLKEYNQEQEKSTGTVPKTNNQVVTNKPAALEIIKGQAVKLQLQINDSKKEARENNQRKQEIVK